MDQVMSVDSAVRVAKSVFTYMAVSAGDSATVRIAKYSFGSAAVVMATSIVVVAVSTVPS